MPKFNSQINFKLRQHKIGISNYLRLRLVLERQNGKLVSIHKWLVTILWLEEQKLVLQKELRYAIQRSMGQLWAMAVQSPEMNKLFNLLICWSKFIPWRRHGLYQWKNFNWKGNKLTGSTYLASAMIGSAAAAKTGPVANGAAKILRSNKPPDRTWA